MSDPVVKILLSVFTTELVIADGVAVAGGEVVEVDESLFEDVDDLTLDDDDVVDSVMPGDADSWYSSSVEVLNYY